MTVSSQDTVFQYVGNGVTTTFAYACQVPTETDLVVYVDDVPQTSGYSVTGIGNLTGGTVIFSSAPANGTSIRLERDIELERSTDYQQNGDFLADVVNPDFDRIWMALQGHLSSIKRAMLFPKSDTVPPNPLPTVANRANMLLSFDSSGQPVVVAPSAQSAAALAILLALPTGASAVGGGDQVVDSISALRGLFKTSPSKYANTIGYFAAGDGGGGRYRYDASDTTSADDGGTVIVASDGGRWKLVHNGTLNALQFGVYPSNSSAVNSANFEKLRIAAQSLKAKVVVPAGTYSLPPNTNLRADNTEWHFLPGAIFKLHDTQATTNFLVANAPSNQRIIGLNFDANRAAQNAASFGPDNSAFEVIDAIDCHFVDMQVISSPAKGFTLVSSVGNYTRRTEIVSFTGGNCVSQVLLVDGNNISGFFDTIQISKVRIGATSHGGLVINDGAHSITVSDVIADVQNSTWDAVSIRDSYDLALTNVVGRRGRSGVYFERLNGLCGRIMLDNVIGELSSQHGVLFAGAEDITAGVVVGRNNELSGVNISAGAASYRCKNINISSLSGYDDRGSPAQDYGILIQGVDGCTLGKTITHGNTVKGVSINRAATTLVDANIRQVVSGTTGSIAASGQAVITLNWPIAFDDASVDIEAVYVFVGTSSLALSIGHVVAITQNAVQVMVKNLSSSTAFIGTLTVIGRRTI